MTSYLAIVVFPLYMWKILGWSHHFTTRGGFDP